MSMNAKELILDAQSKFIQANAGKEPETLRLPRHIAEDLAKLGEYELGTLGTQLEQDGIEALEGQKLYDMTVTLTDEPNLELE